MHFGVIIEFFFLFIIALESALAIIYQWVAFLTFNVGQVLANIVNFDHAIGKWTRIMPEQDAWILELFVIGKTAKQNKYLKNTCQSISCLCNSIYLYWVLKRT